MDKQLSYRSSDSFTTDTSGATAVEFAFLAPLYLLLVLGMSAYGIYFGAAHSVQQLSADAARTAISGLDATERQNLARNFINANASGYLFIDPAKLMVVAKDSLTDSSQFDVTLTYDATGLPIWQLWETLPMPSQTIQRSATIRMGGI